MSAARRVSIFGATGSVGANTVDLLQRQGGAEVYDVVALTGAGNIALLAEQSRALDADIAVTSDPTLLTALREALAGCRTQAAAGPDALLEAASRPTDWVMSAIVGAAGLAPGLKAAEQGGVLALANKESLVCAGTLLQTICTSHGTRLLPVDSEHSAIFQCLAGADRAELETIVLTASGGPFRTTSRDEMATVTPAQAKAHPNWTMGERISIDSATMFNKALEMIEAHLLFDAEPDQVEVLIHPQSIIHSMVRLTDGAIIAQLGPADMRGPIGYALNYPRRSPLPVERLNFADLTKLTFEAEDPVRFPALRLAREVMAAGGLSGAVFNAAKETALDAFLAEQIGFLDMADLVSAALDALGPEASSVADPPDLPWVLDLDARTRAFGSTWVNTR